MSEDAGRAVFRRSVGIPDSAASCHTGIVEGYAVEGHVPASAIARLLADRPDVAGLALAGMPVDSPGMGGALEDWAAQPVVAVGLAGELTPFEF
ncbi:MAG: DUF411 domain-containing protein [Ilumatobacteraceae bacterium]